MIDRWVFDTRTDKILVALFPDKALDRYAIAEAVRETDEAIAGTLSSMVRQGHLTRTTGKYPRYSLTEAGTGKAYGTQEIGERRYRERLIKGTFFAGRWARRRPVGTERKPPVWHLIHGVYETRYTTVCGIVQQAEIGEVCSRYKPLREEACPQCYATVPKEAWEK